MTCNEGSRLDSKKFVGFEAGWIRSKSLQFHVTVCATGTTPTCIKCCLKTVYNQVHSVQTHSQIVDINSISALGKRLKSIIMYIAVQEW